MGVGTVEGLYFDRSFLRDRARLLQCLHDAYLKVLRDPLKNGGPTDRCTQQLSRGYWVPSVLTYGIKKRLLKGENKLEMSGVNYTHDNEFIWL